MAAAMAVMGIAPAAPSGQEPTTQSELPTVACSWSVVVTEVAPDGFNSATAWFSPRTTFKDGSELCIRAKIGATDFSEPACVTIHA
jgi:hypothetical protein